MAAQGLRPRSLSFALRLSGERGSWWLRRLIVAGAHAVARVRGVEVAAAVLEADGLALVVGDLHVAARELALEVRARRGRSSRAARRCARG